MSFRRICTKREEELIRENYRKAEDEPMGYYPPLYEVWTTGKKSEVDAIKKELKRIPSLLLSTYFNAEDLSTSTSSSDSTV